MNLIEKILNDKRYEFLLGLSAYFFLILVLLSAMERNTCIASGLFLASVAAFVAWVIYACIKGKNFEPVTTLGPIMKMWRNMVIFIGYWSLLAVIVGCGSNYGWTLYIPIAISAIAAIAALVATVVVYKKK